MKHLTTILKVLVFAVPLLLGACKSHKKVTETVTPVIVDTETADVMTRVKNNAHDQTYITSKIKFTVEVGSLSQSLTGNLKMKRDDVIRLQLMAFGFVEAARIEFTRDSVLIMDRINKQYLQVPYHYVDFLRKSGINFYTLQAMFWNELFLPDHKQVTTEDYPLFTIQDAKENKILSYNKEKMTYSWLAETATGKIKMANIIYTPLQGDNTQLNWDYRSFRDMNGKSFPDDMHITLTMPSKEVKLSLKLNYLANESDWETRTQVSSKYNEVEVDEILRRFMAM